MLKRKEYMYRKIAAAGLLLIAFSLYPMAQVNRVLVVPIQFRVDTQEWYVLLGQDTGAYFNGYRKKLNNETADQAAVKALANQTNKMYNDTNFSLDKSFKVQAPQGEIIYFVKVPFISAAELKKKGTTDDFKSDFSWIPAQDLLLSQGDFTPSEKTKPVHRKMVETLKEYLPAALHELSKQTKNFAPIAPKPPTLATSSTQSNEARVKEYTTLAQFVLDDNPHQPTEKESSAITPTVENLVDQGFVDSFWISYDQLKNPEGSSLSQDQKNEIITYLKANEQHVDNERFRLANNNFFVLAQGNKDPRLKNKVWRFVHHYLRSLPRLVEQFKKKDSKIS